jgi:hypothetical protein
VELEHLQIKTRLTNEKFASVYMAEVPGQTLKLKLKLKFICSRIKTKAEAESKNCHGKPMLSLEKPMKFI